MHFLKIENIFKFTCTSGSATTAAGGSSDNSLCDILDVLATLLAKLLEALESIGVLCSVPLTPIPDELCEPLEEVTTMLTEVQEAIAAIGGFCQYVNLLLK